MFNLSLSISLHRFTAEGISWTRVKGFAGGVCGGENSCVILGFGRRKRIWLLRLMTLKISKKTFRKYFLFSVQLVNYAGI